MQETSNRHLYSLGCSLDGLRDEKQLAFLLSRIRLEIFAPLYAYENITVSTWTSESKGFAFSRAYEIRRGDELIARADTTWALISLSTHQLCRSDSIDFGFEHEAPVEIDAPSRVSFPKEIELEKVGEREIFFSDCDYNMHMNNTRYPDMICDFLPDFKNKRLSALTLSFVHEASMGHTLSVYRAQKDDNTYLFRTVDTDGVICLEAEATVEKPETSV
jgi:acyl-CoA thioesterase FadM